MRQSRRSDVVFDALAVALAMGATALGAAAGLDVSLGWCAAQALLTLVALHVRRTAPRTLRRAPIDDLAQVLAVTTQVAIFTVAARAAVGHEAGAFGDAVRIWLFATLFLVVRQSDAGAAVRRAYRRGQGQVDTLIVGAGEVGERLAERLYASPELGLRPVGFLDDERADAILPILGPPADGEAVIVANGIGHVIVAFPQVEYEQLVALMRACRRQGVEFSVVPRLFEEVTERVTVEHVGAIPLLRTEQPNPRGWRFGVKYAFDRVVAVMALIVLAPLLALIALAVKLTSRGDVFFRQQRVGRDHRPFTMLKFRTMTGDPAIDGEADASWAAETVDGAPRNSHREVTRVGSVLRDLCLDELPQLINVARGEMSLVGPRPERVSYVERFESEIRRYDDRHRVKAGLTGWAQVNGLRGETSLSDRIEYDNFYIENWSLLLDLRILVLTPVVIVVALVDAVRRIGTSPDSVEPCARVPATGPQTVRTAPE